MRGSRRRATILAFPGSEREAAAAESLAEAAALEAEDAAGPEIEDWPEIPLDTEDAPLHDAVFWLDDALVSAKLLELNFLRALDRVPRYLLPDGTIDDTLEAFRQLGRRITLALELVRLGQIEPDDVAAHLPGLRRGWQALRTLRFRLMDRLEPRARAFAKAEEARAVLGRVDVERLLRERSRARTIRPDRTERHLSVPGSFPLLLPNDPELVMRVRRELRLGQDHRPVNVDMDLAGWLEELPHEWLEGIARGLGLLPSSDRWDQERAIVDRLTRPYHLKNVVRKLSPIERTILARVLEARGVLRYDHLVHRYGADEETAWHWAEEVPTTPLERVRRTGLLFVGVTRIGRRAHRVGVVPVDIRDDLDGLLVPMRRL